MDKTAAAIHDYICSLAEPRRTDMQRLHNAIREIAPDERLWFLDGKNDDGKTVSNPNIGYGTSLRSYVGGKSREFYKVGISANTAGISVYIFGYDDKTYLARTYGRIIGKASVSGYCIKFGSLAAINWGVLMSIISDALASGTRP